MLTGDEWGRIGEKSDWQLAGSASTFCPVNKKTIEVLAKLFAVTLFVYLCFSAYKVLDMMGAV